MRIKTVKYQRVKNLGNYETERVELEAEVVESEDHRTVAAKLRDEVTEILFGDDIDG